MQIRQTIVPGLSRVDHARIDCDYIPRFVEVFGLRVSEGEGLNKDKQLTVELLCCKLGSSTLIGSISLVKLSTNLKKKTHSDKPLQRLQSLE